MLLFSPLFFLIECSVESSMFSQSQLFRSPAACVCEPGFIQHKASLCHGWLTWRDFQASPQFRKEITYSSRRALLWKLLETPSLLIEKHFFLHILTKQFSSGRVSFEHFLPVALVAAHDLAPLIYSQGSGLNTTLKKPQKTLTISLR